MICPKCGAENINGSTFCVKCGTNLNGQASNNMNYTPIQNEQIQQPIIGQPTEQLQQPTNNYSQILNNETGINKFSFINNKTKKILLIVIFALIVIAGFILIKNIGGGSKDYKADLFDPKKPILIKKDNKYGYINDNGKIIINPIYEEASNFNGKYSIVKTKEDDKEIYQIIDKKGKVKFASEYSGNIEYDSTNDVWFLNNKLYNGNLKQISKDDLAVKNAGNGYFSWTNDEKKTAGIMNSKGKVTYTYNFLDEEYYLSIDASETADGLTEHYCVININNKKYAIVNCDSGKIVYNFTDKYITESENNVFKVMDHSTFEVLSTMFISKDKIAYESSSDSVYLEYDLSGYIKITDYNNSYDDRYKYYDIKEQKIVDKKNSEDANTISKWENLTGLNKFSCDNGKGLMKGEKVVLSCEWSDINFFDTLLYQYLKNQGKDYILASKDKKTYLVNLKNGKTITEFNSSSVISDPLSTFLYYKDKDTNKIVVYNLISGKNYTTAEDNSINIYSNYITIKENNKLSYYNTKLKLIYTEDV